MVTGHANEGARSEGTFADSAQGSLSPFPADTASSAALGRRCRVLNGRTHLHLNAVRLLGALVGPSVLGPSQFPYVLRSPWLGDLADEGAPT